MEQEKKLSLLIQTYKGGVYFNECLASVEKNIDSFYKIFISINNSPLSKTDYETACIFKNKFPKKNINIILRSSMLSAMEHTKVFYKEIIKSHDDSDFYFILCHDDILAPDFSENIISVMHNSNNKTVINASRSFYNDSFTKNNYIGTYYGLLSYPDLTIAKEDFANKSFDNSPRTSITGLIFPNSVLKEYYSLIHFFSYGYRAEFCILCSYTTSFIQGTLNPLVFIREHAGQEGATRNSEYLRKDEFLYRYYIWYTINNKSYDKILFKRLIYTISSPKELLYLLHLNIFLFFKTKRIYKLVCIPYLYKSFKKAVKHILIKCKLYEAK